MVRNFALSMLLALVALVGFAGLASAQDYVPVPITGALNSTSSAAQPVHEAAVQNLSYTGSGINIGLAVAIGLLVLLVGVGLVFFGNRMARRSGSRHH